MKYENIREVDFDENSPSLRGSGGVELTPAYLQSHNIPTENLIFSKNFLPYNPKLKENSKALRKGGILSEVILWKELRADQFNGYSFYRQKPILNYIVDFYCKELNLVIEIDGFSHESDEAIQYDKERDRQMAVLGLRVLRVSDSEVKKNLQSVLSRIGDFTLPSHMEATPPNPLKEGEAHM